MNEILNGYMIAFLLGAGILAVLTLVCVVGEKIIKLIGEDRFLNFMYGDRDED